MQYFYLIIVISIARARGVFREKKIFFAARDRTMSATVEFLFHSGRPPRAPATRHRGSTTLNKQRTACRRPAE